MEENKDEWICSCGTVNTQNFCANCGKKRENVLQQQTAKPSLLENTQVLSEAKLSGKSGAHGPINSTVTGGKQSNTVKYLAGVAVILFLVAVGLYAYLSGSEERYVAKCEAVQKIVLDVQSALKDIKDLNGDPEADDTKKYLERLKTGESNLENIQKDLKGMRGSSKYKESNSILLEALLLERNILQDVESVLKDPLASDSSAVIKRVHDNITELAQNAGRIEMEHTDFPRDFQLGSLADDLNKYVEKKKAIDIARKAEQARLAREAAIAKAAAFRKQLNEKNQSLMNTNELVWITTNVNVQGSNLVVQGYFYNGTSNQRIVKVNSMVVHVNLSADGEAVATDAQAQFYDIYMPGILVPGGRHTQQLIIQNGAPNRDFNEFDVTADDIHWLYR